MRGCKPEESVSAAIHSRTVASTHSSPARESESECESVCARERECVFVRECVREIERVCERDRESVTAQGGWGGAPGHVLAGKHVGARVPRANLAVWGLGFRV